MFTDGTIPQQFLEEWKNLSSKPMYLSEAGSDSYMTIEKLGYLKGENQLAQADANSKILNSVFKNSEHSIRCFNFSVH